MSTLLSITKLLIANRGEIALRIHRAAESLGIATLGVYSDVDRYAPYVKACDQAVHLPGKASADTYLRGDLLIAIAKRYGANAVHPGYGFLSEQAQFAKAVVDEGLIWVGPSAASIEAVGSKSAAKALAKSLNIQVLEAFEDSNTAAQAPEALAVKALAMGGAVMVKAIAGGGGRGMRLIRGVSLHQATELIASAQREAQAAFGNSILMLERALLNPRHVEVQLLADQHGHCIHLGERDCSVQRRNQKIIEETPSPALSADQREAICASAVRFAKAAGYTNAGTVEFLVEDGQAYLMEMNTRIQVEHPVTEAVTGIDLVQWQLRIAQGEYLPISQEEVTAKLDKGGHAIEVRLCAEDESFAPQTGKVQALHWPSSNGIRIDSGINEASTVSPWYDSMLAKLIVHAPTREAARIQMTEALQISVIAGVTSNRAMLIQILQDKEFARGNYTVPTLSKRSQGYADAIHAQRASLAQQAVNAIESNLARGHALSFLLPRPSRYTFQGQSFAPKESAAAICTRISPTHWHVHIEGHDLIIADTSFAPSITQVSAHNAPCIAKVNGKLVKVLVNAGDSVVQGQALVVIESMKLEQTLSASANAVVEKIFVREGEQVKPGQTLVGFQA